MATKKIINHLNGAQKLFEVGIIISLLIAVFIAISLFSFSPSDPSWSQQQWVAQIDNAGGRAGAWIADVLFYAFGVLAYGIPLIIPFLAWMFFWKPQFDLDIDYLNLTLRIVGFFFTVFSTEGLASLNFDDFHYYPSGGLIGDVISQSMLGFFSLLAVNLILLTFLISGTTLLLGFSWLRLVDGLGETAIFIASYLWNFSKREKKNKADKEDKNKDKLKSKTNEKIDSTKKPKKPFFLTRFKKKHKTTKDTSNEKLNEELNEEDQNEQHDEPLVFSSQASVDEEEQNEGLFSDIGHEDESDQDDLFPELDRNTNIDIAEDVNETPYNDDDFAHLPEHARPTKKSNVNKNMAPFPSIDLLDLPKKQLDQASAEELEIAARLVESKLMEFKIKAEVVNVLPGPVITRFELSLAPGMKVSTVSSLEKDLARSLSAMSVRVVDQIPGKAVIALELPNKNREIVYSSQVLGSKVFQDAKSSLSMVLGADISGEPVVVDLAKMPHLLVAGTTGSGKSVGVNCMIVSLLYKSAPEDVRMILIDPKMLELSVYEGIPHLLTEVVTDMKDAANALRWCVGEMERRYKLLSAVGVRTLDGFNKEVKEAKEAGEPLCDPLWKPGDSMDESAPELEKLPKIVVVVDEFADMMMIVGKKCEELITRIAQKARAAGIHLILATQRPSVDVITGLIKANIPTRIAFQVSSKIDSRTILGMQGAETLLGHGDMLYLPPGTGVATRVHGAFVDDHEVHRVVSDWKKRGEPNYVKEILDGDLTLDSLLPGEENESDDALDGLFDEVVQFITETRKVSISSIQRKFRIGYNRSARLVDQLQAQGVISSPSGANSSRDVLAPPPVKV